MVATIRLGCAPNTCFFLDTCFVNNHDMPASVWNAMLRHRIMLPPLMLYELREWLTEPYRNRYFCDQVRTAIHGNNPSVELLDPSLCPFPLRRAAEIYTRLLGVRKIFALLKREEFVARHHRQPTKPEMQSLCHRTVGDRGLRLARKGEQEYGTPSFSADEELVVWSVLTAIVTGMETILITRDTDVLEQFYKLVYLLDTHYRSHLIASEYAIQPWNFSRMPVQTVPMLTAALEVQDGVLIRIPFRFDEHVLPSQFHPVVVSCWLLGGEAADLSFVPVQFCAEREMQGVLRAKATTNGLSTSKLNGLNCHRCIHQQLTDVFGDTVAIGKDKTFGFEGELFPQIDVDLTLRPHEGTLRLLAG